MSEAKSIAGKKDSKEAKHKQCNEGSAFPNIADDGLLTGPSVKTATQAEDAALLSDDENKTLTTLEPAKKPSGRDDGKVGLAAMTSLLKKPARDDAGVHTAPATVVGSSPANPVPSKKSLTKPIVTTRDLLKTLKEQSKTSQSPPVEAMSKESLLQKMRERLSKQIEIKSTSAATPATPVKELDTSGAIEIPQDLILGSEIPPTPISAIETKETKLEDHDLIAILEGNDVEIRENATEIEVCVGTNTSDEVMQEMEIYIVDKDEVQKAKKEREMEIARRQMANLPKFPKKRRTVSKPSTTNELPGPKATAKGTVAEATKLPVQDVLSKLPPGVTIKRSKTVRPGERKSPVVDVPIKEEKVPKEKASKERVTKAAKEVRPAAIVEPEPAKSSPARTKTTPASPQTPTKSTELVDSLVSDWDDEPVAPQQAVAVKEEKSKTSQEDKNEKAQKDPESDPLGAAEEAAPEEAKFATPTLPVAGEPRRVIKKKIIWDPSDATIPFSVLVKSNRGNAPASQPPVKENPPVGAMRRKRAESVAVRMFAMPHSAPKRALTPEPVREPVPDREGLRTTVAENNNIANPKAMLDAKSKKRKKNEIERLLADEGAINMLYDVECEANKKDLLKNTTVDTDDEDEKLLAKTKIITDAVINHQGKSPTEGTSQQGLRVRAKRAITPLNQPASANVDPASPKPDASADTSTNTTASPPAAAKKSNNGPASTPLTGARKRKNPSTLKDWDFVYNAQGGDDAMIIRRRSNSSYSSSCASPRRLSVDQSLESSAGVSTSVKKTPNQEQQVDDSFLFAKPSKPATAEPEEIVVDPSLLANMRGRLTKALKNIKAEPTEPAAKKTASPPTPAANSTATKQPQTKRKVAAKASPVPLAENTTSVEYVVSPTGELIRQDDGQNEAVEARLNEMKQISWVRNGEYVEIVLKTKSIVASGGEGTGVRNDVFSMEAMNELTEVFTLLEKQSRVTAVLLMSAGDHFSRGIDVAHLVQPIHKRKVCAEEMAECLRSFLKALISFSKPIVAAVHGDVLGMGVTILPVFDIVLAQTGSSFTTPYGTFGYLPEAMKAFTSFRTLKPRALSDLLLLGKRLSTAAALDYGLVTEIIPAERFSDRARALVKKVATQSVQAMQSIKQHQRREFLAKMDFVLTLEQKKHAQQWTTAECQQRFKAFLAKGGDLGKNP